ncbi:hypothetical protein Pen02_45360 [Plantactinospora endophytica]|uniref:Alkaline shock response membrane anchor protein AmaP n=2 Tax=Plantactinospora endophytica TaxID=673535 RepID=A0ABQ4E4I3_9ACTN|nr:hypothetical protein [Plantactinospora endophytica]GIG89600.1 hypothetical protein Pen02_45360 [Plantactinospora endophytica]
MYRYHLSIGFHGTRALRVVFVVVLGGMATLASGCLGFILGMMLLWVIPDRPDRQLTLGYLPLVTAGLLALAVVVYVALVIAFGVRLAAWLEGTRLTVRGLRQRSVELADARSVALRQINQKLVGPVRRSGIVGPAQPVSVLDVADGNGRVRLRLASREAVQLPPEQLLTLANALSTARCPGADEVVAWLRGTAALAQRG